MRRPPHAKGGPEPCRGSGSRPCKGRGHAFCKTRGAVGRRLALALGFGLISLFFSEFFFLNEAPVLAVLEGENHVAFFLEFTLYYALFAYLALGGHGQRRQGRTPWG